jgi:hypothetical protein
MVLVCQGLGALGTGEAAQHSILKPRRTLMRTPFVKRRTPPLRGFVLYFPLARGLACSAPGGVFCLACCARSPT